MTQRGVNVAGIKAIETGMILLIMNMKKTLCVFFFKDLLFTEIREFATIVLWKLVTNVSYRGRTTLVYISFLVKWRHKIVTVFKSL